MNGEMLVDITTEQMIPLAQIPTMHMPIRLPVHRDYDTAMVGAYRLDLDGIGQLQVALDRAVEAIRAYQDRQAADSANCPACWHLWELHHAGVCAAKVYPAGSLAGEPCPCKKVGENG